MDVMRLGYHAHRLSQLKDLFSGCFERVDMDLVFFEDSQQGQRSEVTSKHTVAYLLTWLLVIRAMSRCGPEVSGRGCSTPYTVCICMPLVMVYFTMYFSILFCALLKR